MRFASASRAGFGGATGSRRERGVVFFALFRLLLFGMFGVLFHAALVASANEQLQRAADAAALAAARQVEADAAAVVPDFAQTRQVAADAALHNQADAASVRLDLNTGNDPDGDIVVGVWNDGTATFTPDLAEPNAVRVRARRAQASFGSALDLVVGPLLGALFPESGASATATAAAPLDAEPRPVVLVLAANGAGALRLSGGSTLDISTGKLQVNSADPCAIRFSGSPSLSALKVSTRGGICPASGLVQGELVVGAPVILDPLAGLLPDEASWESFKSSLPRPLGAKGSISGSGSFAPGYYPGGVSLAGQAAATLQPGLYLLGGEGLSLRGGATLAGARVALLIDRGGQVDVRGEAGLRLIAPGPGSGGFRDIALVSHRGNAGLAVSLGGTGDVHIQGTVYVPSGTFRMAGGPRQELDVLITDRLESVGDASLRADGPPEAESGSEPVLVE